MFSKPTALSSIEYKIVPFNNEQEYLRKWCDTQTLRQNSPEFLGLHKRPKGLAPGNFIGAIWLGETETQTPLIVRSKFPQMDYMSMYLACAEDSIVGDHLGKCFDFWPDQPLIEAEDLPKLSELLIAAFLRELNELCSRHLRKHFERETNNLIGKVKGKILLHAQVKQNLAHGRNDRVFCSYQVINDDIAENRVLRAALEQSAKFINAKPDPSGKFPVLNRWIHSSRSALSGVSVVKVNRSDFRNLRDRGSFSHYRRALELAKFVLLRLGGDPHAEVRQENIATPPFAINSAELFERYAEKVLREEYPELEAGYEKSNTQGDNEGFNVTVRPDFWIPKTSDKSAKVIDAKYKSKKEIEDENQSDENTSTEKPSRADTFQMVSYSRHGNLLNKKLNCDNTDNIELALVYPNFEQEEEIKEIKTDNSFLSPLKMLFVKCPVIKEEIIREAA